VPNRCGRAFEWDPAKARANVKKHAIDFADATAVFEDDRAITIPDELSAVDERRVLTLGRDALGRVLVVAYTWRGSAIRIFSARRATRRERRQYVEDE
jgi:uncharacterized DUF497 family protein